jgi:hypothetical protein
MSKSKRETSYTTEWADDEIRPFPAWCDAADISPATGRRLKAAGEGPIITHLSARRIGVQGRHHRQWLDQRARKTTVVLALLLGVALLLAPLLTA